jgi:hypothetical protein
MWGATIVPDDARLQTAETDTKVRQLWKLGLPGKQIARILKLSSAHAVYGRMWRMGIRRPAIVSMRNRFNVWGRRRIDRIAELKGLKPRPLGGPLPPLPDVPCEPRLWLERDDRECAFPVAGESVTTMSCCNRAGRSGYCAAHRAAMLRPI